MKKYKKIIVLLSLVIVAVITISQVKKQELSPAVINTERQTKFIAPEQEKLTVQEMAPLRADGFEIQIISEKSDAGAPGDILLTIKGSGFYLTSVSPRLSFGKDFIVKHTEVNSKGSELYVVLSKETVKKLIDKKTDFREATVLVGERPAKDSAKIAITPESFNNTDRFSKVSLKYRKGFFERVLSD